MAINYIGGYGQIYTERPEDQSFSLANGDTVEDLILAGLGNDFIAAFLNGNSIGISYDANGQMQITGSGLSNVGMAGPTGGLTPEQTALVNEARARLAPQINEMATRYQTDPNDPRYASYQASSQAAAQYASMTPEQRATSARQSAYDLLYNQFNQYGLGSLVEGIKNLITSNVSPSEFSIRLRETDAYKKRFAANAQRIAKGLTALDEASYLALEDQYQNIMRNYGLPESYYARGDMGRQEGFEKFIAFDVSPAELETRIQTAQRRVLNAAPEIKDALLQYYGTDITNGDVLAYILDPQRGLENINRKVTAAEIGGAAARFGLDTARSRAEQLQTYGISGEQALAGYEAIGGGIERASLLSSIYGGDYTQTSAESEIFKLPSAIEARKQRTQLSKQEQATFAGSTGVTGGALARERAGQF